jgi:sensor c-di-GMP phosphodiesterase-like protein
MNFKAEISQIVKQACFSVMVSDYSVPEPTGAEALIRWNSTSLGQVPPFEFIPVTERNETG